MGRQNLRAKCEKCFGLCCVALYFSASEGFPVDKDAGKPCLNLKSDFSCGIYKALRVQGLKGCTAFDCFGAGQKVAQVTYGGYDWRQVPESADQMYKVFQNMRQIHEMLWYLTEALTLQWAYPIHSELNSMLNETERLTLLSSDSIVELDLVAHRSKVNTLLLQTGELVRSKIRSGQKTSLKSKRTLGRGLDLIGADLRRTDLRGANLRGVFLIAADLRGVSLSGADLLGADLRDADIRGTDFSEGFFLTQAQINTAMGDSNTKLPLSLTRPPYWVK